MATPAPQQPAPDSSGLTPRLLPAAVLLAWLGAALLLCALLWPQWRENPELSHGFAAPLLFVILLAEAGTAGAQTPAGACPRPPARAARWLPPLLSLLACGSLLLAALYAAAFGWAHANAAFLASLAFSLGGASLLLCGQVLHPRLPSLNWKSVVALLLWPLAAPLPPGTYSRLAGALQSFVSEGVLQALNLLGVAAVRHGNILELSRTQVGVEEACSGVRSLIACLFVALFFSAVLLRRPWTRVLLLVLVGPFALGMNFLRSLALTLVADSGRSITGAWHDLTGHAILVLTAAGLLVLCLLLRRLEKHPLDAEKGATVSLESETRPGTRLDPGPLHCLILMAAPLLGLLLLILQLGHPKPPVRSAPDLNRLLPAQAAGWEVQTDTSVLANNGILSADTLLQRRYLGEGRHITLYAAYWAPGHSNPGRIALHTPEACWPGAGWVQLSTAPAAGVETGVSAGDQELPAGLRMEHRRFRSPNGSVEHVYYWLLQGGHAVPLLNPYRPDELLKLFVSRENHPGDSQLFLRISSNRPWTEIRETEPVRELLRQTAEAP